MPARIMMVGSEETNTKESRQTILQRMRENKFIEVFDTDTEAAVTINSDLILWVVDEDED